MSSSMPYNVTGTSATNTYSEEKLQKQLVVLIEPLSKSVIEKFTKPKDKVLRLKYKNFTFPKMYTQITNEEKKTTFKKYSLCRTNKTNYLEDTNSLTVLTTKSKGFDYKKNLTFRRKHEALNKFHTPLTESWKSSLWSAGHDINTLITGYHCHGSNVEQIPESVLTETIHKAVSEKLKEISFESKFVTRQQILPFQSY